MKYYNLHTHCLPSDDETKEAFTLYNLNREELYGIPDLPENCGATAGIHPWWLYGTADRNDMLERLRFLLADAAVFAVGECGLDGNTGVPLSEQAKWFLAQTELAEEAGKPVIIHCVKAYNELIRLRRDFKPSRPWIIHGFRGKPQLGAELVRHGFYLSLGENFNRLSFTTVPVNRVFAETDDGCVPVEKAYARIGEAWKIPPDALQEQIRSNFRLLFPESR